MKKIKQTIFWAFLLVAATACQKEETVQGSVTRQMSLEEQVAVLIQKGDPRAYEIIYGDLRAPEPSIKITHGIFSPPPGAPQDGTCLPNSSCVCHITIEWPRLVTSNDSTNLEEDYVMEYTELGEAEIILNDGQATTIENVKSVSIDFDDEGGSVLDYEIFE